jgi:hypothetical protein
MHLLFVLFLIIDAIFDYFFDYPLTNLLPTSSQILTIYFPQRGEIKYNKGGIFRQYETKSMSVQNKSILFSGDTFFRRYCFQAIVFSGDSVVFSES